MADPKQSRGYRNRNPGNIEYAAANRWQGQTGIEVAPAAGGKPRFAVFQSHEYGIRALAALLTTYQDRHGLRTVRQIIGRWAPGAENDTAAYVRHVCARMDRAPGDALDLHAFSDLRPLVEAIITHELGGQPYSAATIDAGLALAGVPRPVESVAEAAQTGTGRGAITVGAAASAAATAAPVIAALGDLNPWLAAGIVVAAAAVAVAWVLARRRRAAA